MAYVRKFVLVGLVTGDKPSVKTWLRCSKGSDGSNYPNTVFLPPSPSFFLSSSINFYVYGYFDCMYVRTLSVPHAFGGQKMAFSPLGLWLQTVVSFTVNSGN